jgi:hypothetical protein
VGHSEYPHWILDFAPRAYGKIADFGFNSMFGATGYKWPNINPKSKI